MASVPIATIIKIKKEKKNTSDQYENIEVHCKDMRTLFFGLSKEKSKRKFFLEKLVVFLPQVWLQEDEVFM